MTIAYRLQTSTGHGKLLVESKVTFRPGWLKSLNWKWLKNSIKLSLISCFHSKQVCSAFYFISHLFLVFDGSVLFHFLLKKYLEKVILKKMENEKFSELKTNLFQNGHL